MYDYIFQFYKHDKRSFLLFPVFNFDNLFEHLY